MTTPLTVEDIQTWNNSGILKVTRGSMFVADYAGTTDPTTIFDGLTPQGLVALPTGFFDAGYTTTDGLTFSRAITMNEVNSWQSQEVTQSDVETDQLTFHAIFQEHNHVTLALAENQNLADAPATGAAYAVDRSSTGQQPLRKVLIVGEAKTGGDLIYVGRYFPQCKVSAIGDEQWARTQEVRFDFTFTAYPDKTFGASARRYVGGPGWAALGA